jgi:hypothetical protein
MRGGTLGRTVSRRAILQGVAGTLGRPLWLTRAEAQVTPEVVRFRPEIEPLVARIERTPRERCAEMAVEELQRGVSYRQFLAALFLAGVRNVNPRPPGFALHCVFVIHSAHLIGMEAPPDARLLPLFYALDNFKTAQERDAKQAAGDYMMRPLAGALPAPDRAAEELAAALEAWEPERAERAVAALSRRRSAAEVFGRLWRYGARDYRNIGHKAIYVANACRTLQTIGWQHAEPVLRSVVAALLDFGKEQQVNGYALEDQCYGANARRVKEVWARLPEGWAAEQSEAAAVRSLLDAWREASPEEACADLAGRLAKGQATAGAAWDAVHLAAAELRMRAGRGAALAAVHAVTSANALHYSYLEAPDPQLRLLLLLQAAGWMGQFRTFAATRQDGLRAFSITSLEENAADGDSPATGAYRQVQERAGRQAYLAAALRHTAAKADEVHYYKYVAALVEDAPLVSPEFQPHLLAAVPYYAKKAADPDPAPMKRAREALRALAA